VALTTGAMMAWYYSVVDIDWLREQLFASNADIQKMAPEQRAAAMNFVGRNMLLISSVVGACMGIPFFYLLTALYFLVVAKVAKIPLGLKHWFSLVSWCSLPVLLNVLAAVIFLLLRDNDQIAPGVMQPLSLNELVLHIPMGAKGQTFFESMSIPAILNSILTIIGMRAWSERSWLFCTFVSLLPVALIYGVWAIFAFR
jgi:hypothetical protein